MYTQIGQRDQKRKFVFAVNKILLMMTKTSQRGFVILKHIPRNSLWLSCMAKQKHVKAALNKYHSRKIC
jgi:hypothetical protein